MARRNGRKGTWLATDDYTGKTVYANKLQIDYWGNYTTKPLKRNLQEIASPLNDPQPVPFYRGPTYEAVSTNSVTTLPTYVGLTNVKTSLSYGSSLFVDVGIGEAAIGTTFIVR